MVAAAVSRYSAEFEELRAGITVFGRTVRITLKGSNFFMYTIFLVKPLILMAFP